MVQDQGDEIEPQGEGSVEGGFDDPTKTVRGPRAHEAAPTKIGQYHIKRVIATGGMGTVYEATQEHPRRVVAVKVMKLGIVSRSALRRFEYESQLLARLRHPGIAQVYEAGTHRDVSGTVPFFAMEYIPNARPITAYVNEKKLGSRGRLELFAHVCDAVHHGHQKGIIHRDLKPANILIDSQGQPKIIDFGVARSTDSDMAVTTLQTDVGQLIGTLQYMSPEQCDADPHDIDTRSDVYALGVVFYELLCGRRPYDVTHVTMYEATRVIREQRPTKLSTINRTLRGDVETIVLKSLEKERERRYQSAADLAQDIRRYLNREAISARPPSIIYQLRIFARRNKAVFAAIAAVFIVLVAGVIASTSMYLRAENAREEAETRRIQAEEVTNFLNETLASVDPAKAMGREVTVKEMLDQAAKNIDNAFPTMPLVEAGLRTTIGYTYCKLSKYDAAERHLEIALRLRRQHLGGDHPLMADALSARGALFRAKGEYKRAEPLWREALRIRRKSLGEEHKLVAQSLSDLGLLAWDQADYAVAEPLFHKALAMRRKLLGNEHQQVASSLNDLGNLLAEKGEYAEAEAHYSDALAMRRRLLPGVHPEVAESLNNMAALLTDKGDYAAAEPLYRETLAINRKLYGEEHQEIARLLYNLGEVLFKKGDSAEAERLIRDALAMQRKLGEDHSYEGAMLTTQAEILLARGDAAAAESVLREAVAILQKAFPEGHWITAQTESILGECLSVLGRYPEAEPVLVGSYQVIKEVRRADDRYALEALDRIVRLYEAWGKPDKAAEYRAMRPSAELAGPRE